MLFIRVIPENYGTILKRCYDLSRDLLEEHEDSERLTGMKRNFYVTPPGWSNREGRRQRYSIIFPESMLEEEMDFPHGRSETDWFQATRKKS